MNIYSLGRTICKAYFKTFYKVEIIGSENIPKTGPVILCCNHISNLDPPLLGSFVNDREIHYMAKAELFEKPILKSLLPKIHAFPVKRGLTDKQALRTAINLLKEGKVLGIFPEGTRSKTGELRKGLSGVGFFALRSDAVVVPCAIIGPYKRFKRLKLVYGKPIDMTNYRKERISAEEMTAIIMQEIANLIEQYK